VDSLVSLVHRVNLDPLEKEAVQAQPDLLEKLDHVEPLEDLDLKVVQDQEEKLVHQENLVLRVNQDLQGEKEIEVNQELLDQVVLLVLQERLED